MKNTSNDKLTLIENNLKRVNFWIANSDAKTGMLLTFQAGLTAFLTTKAGEIKQIITFQSFSLIHFFLYFSVVIYGFFLIRSVFYAFKALYPDINSRELSVFYFGSIASMGAEKFKKQFKAMTDEEAIDEINSQVYINSQIAVRKFNDVKSGIKSLIFSGFFWIIILILIPVLLR